MLIKSYITTQPIQIMHFNEITQYTNMITVEVLLFSNKYFTYQRKGNQELQIQLLNVIVADLQNQINNISNSNQPPDDDPEPGMGYA